MELTTDIDPELIEGCRDSGARTDEAKAIYMTSRRIAEEVVGDNSPEGRIRMRCMIATGDPEVADIMRFNNNPVEAGIEAIRNGAPVFVDINMVKAGISRKEHDCPIICVLDEDRDAEVARKYGITRTAAGFLMVRDRLEGSIVVIGNAPSAALAVCRMVEHGICPALIIGTPVGFVNAAESKEEIRKLNIPSVTCEGTRGGTPMAVASLNEIIAIASEK